MKKEALNMVLDEELEATLNAIGELHKIEGGEAFCDICGNLISLHNLQMIVADEESFSYVCNKVECVEAMRLRGGKNA